MRKFMLGSLTLAAGAALFIVSGPAMANYIGPKVDVNYPHAQPPYPASAEAAGEEGTTVLQLRVNSAGHLLRVKIAQSSGFPDLDNAAVQAAFAYHYLPAHEGDDTYSDDLNLAIKFQLPPPAPAQTQTSTTPASYSSAPH